MWVNGVDRTSIDFKALLLRIRDGVVNCRQDNRKTHDFNVPPEFLITRNTPEPLINRIYPNVSTILSENNYVNWVSDRVIILPRIRM